jgi:tetratricopeptide (TPR) repeat protein
LDEAIVLDPNYAPAHAQRAITTLLLRDEMYGSIPKAQAMAQAKLYIDKALALDPDLAEANAALGLYHISRPQESELAVEPLQKALAINPNMVNAANWLSTALGNLGRVPESIALYEDMTERDPFYRPGIHGAVGLFNATGRTDQSWALIDRISPFFPEDPMLSRLRGMTFVAEGLPGDAIPLLEYAVEREPSSTAARFNLGIALVLSGQYERAAEIEIPRLKAWALFQLDRSEEAHIITEKIAASGENVGDHIYLMVMSEKYADTINFFESRWPDFDAFEVDFPPLGSGDISTYGNLAQAYASVGNDERFKESMVRFRRHLDRLKGLGFDFESIYLMEAVYFALGGDHENALKNLSLAVDDGLLTYPRMSKDWVQLKPLEGDPKFEAIQARMVKHMNEERAKVNLGPMSI